MWRKSPAPRSGRNEWLLLKLSAMALLQQQGQTILTLSVLSGVFEKSSRHTMAKLALLPLTFHSTQWAVSEQLGKPETTVSLKNTQSSNLPLRLNPIIWSCALKGPNHISLWLLSSAGMRLWASCLIQESQEQA